MENRKMQLLEAEYRRHLSLMRADTARAREAHMSYGQYVAKNGL